MKKLIPLFAVIIAAIAIVASCTKSGDLNAPKGQIAISKLKVKINEPDSMAFVGADTTKATVWTISPSGKDTLVTARNAAIVRFTKAGNYTINASNNAVNANPVTVTVIDSVFVRTPSLTPFNDDERITIIPKYVKSTATDSAYLAFTMKTKDAYCGNSHLEFGIYFDSSMQAYYMTLDGVSHAFQCGGNSSTLTANIDYRSYVNVNPFPNGTFAFTVGYNNQVNAYHGTITVTSATVTFNWPDASVVDILPKVLTR